VPACLTCISTGETSATAGVAVGIAHVGVHAPYPLALLLTVCWVAVSTDPRTSFVCGVAVEAVLLAAILIWSPEAWWAPVNLELLLWPALAVAAGEAVRHRRALVTAMEDRVRRLETSREEELRHRVIEERLRIARELHDVVAHHIALINVQAAVAAHVLYEQPSVAETALRHVTEAGSSVLDELGSLLAVLRQPGDPEAPVEPTPGLDRLDELLDRFAAAGLRVGRRVDGEPHPPPIRRRSSIVVLPHSDKSGLGAPCTLGGRLPGHQRRHRPRRRTPGHCGPDHE